MKIGIITFWNSQDNYGQVSQLFAMQSFLKSLGHEPFLIKYIDNDDKPIMFVEKTIIQRFVSVCKKPSKLFSYGKLLINKKLFKYKEKNINRNFDVFREKYIKSSEKTYFSYKELIQDPPVADIYLCGSDMIWNENVTNPAYLLGFGKPDIIKIAFAPSFAKSVVSDEYIKKLKCYLKDFKYVGVREKSGVEICKKAEYDKAEWVPDPTMLMTKNQYIDSFSLKESTNKFVFVYLLGSKLELDIGAITDFANERHLEVKYVASQFKTDSYDKIYPTIEEWFENIKNAEYVFTNSFHCCVISLIFNKKFIFIPLKGVSATSNERIYSLFEDFNINREYNGNLELIDEDINWLSVNANLKEKQIKVEKLFKEILAL